MYVRSIHKFTTSNHSTQVSKKSTHLNIHYITKLDEQLSHSNFTGQLTTRVVSETTLRHVRVVANYANIHAPKEIRCR